MDVKEKHPYKLLVEGNDDQHVIWALGGEYKLQENFDVIDCHSVENAIRQFQFRLKTGSNTTERMAIVLDADLDLSKRWNSLKAILDSTEQYIVPEALPKQGLILFPINPGGMKIGIWIMPDNNLCGMLEDFLLLLAPTDDALLKKADTILSEIEAEGFQRYKPVHKAKARIHTWLSWQENPGTPMGQAITKQYLSTDKPLCQAFVHWLKELFN